MDTPTAMQTPTLSAPRLLYIDDDSGMGLLLQRRLGRNGMSVDLTGTVRDGLAALDRESYDAVIVDYWLPGETGAALLRALAGNADAPPVIMLTGSNDTAIAVEAMKLGAADFMLKDVACNFLTLLPTVIARVLGQRRLEREHHATQALAQVTLNSIGDAVITTDSAGRITYLNPVAETLTGWPLEQARHRCLEELFALVDEETRRPEKSPLCRALGDGTGAGSGKSTLMQTRDGRELSVRCSAEPMSNGYGAVIGAVLVFRDVSGQREWERRLELFLNVFQNTSEAVVVTDANARIVDINRAFSDITGYRRDEVLGCSPSMMSSGRHDAEFFAEMWRCLKEEGRWQGEIWDRRKDDGIYAKWLCINAVHDRSGRVTHYVGIFNDITPFKETETELYRLAHFDPLTGLPNRMLFQDRLHQSLRAANRREGHLAVMFIDLDRFKEINDTLGHRAGDRLLIEVADRLRGHVRESDTVARLGGDEFTAILEDIGSANDAAHIAGKIVDAFAAPFRIGGNDVLTSPSIGIALYPDAGTTVETLIRAADDAMYRAKEQGRNTFRFYCATADRNGREHLALEQELPGALARSELRLLYQPLYHLDDGEVIGAEALLRWQHPQRGLLLPEHFLQIAEESGAIITIGDWVLTEACRQAAQWQKEGPFQLAVNISARQLEDEAFPERLGAILQQSGYPPERLQLELPEHALLTGGELPRRTIDALHALGVGIAVDDFATGRNSLLYPVRLGLDAIKLDRTHLAAIGSGNRADATVRAVLALGRCLNLKVIAEGVETEYQREFLRAETGIMGQGFLLSEPLPAADIIRLLKRQAS